MDVNELVESQTPDQVAVAVPLLIVIVPFHQNWNHMGPFSFSCDSKFISGCSCGFSLN